MQLPLAISTGFILGSGVTMALCYLWFKYKVFKPYEKAVTQALDQSQVNIKEQGKLIKQQDVTYYLSINGRLYDLQLQRLKSLYLFNEKVGLILTL